MSNRELNMLLRKILALSIFATALFFNASIFANIYVATGTKDYRPLQLQSYKELARIGELSAELSINDIELHNYSVGLLSQLLYMQQFSGCYDDLKGYKVRVEKCQNTFIDHGLQTQFWSQFVEIMAFSMRPNTHKNTFCKNTKDACSVTRIENILLPETTNPRVNFRRPDEFEVRDLADQVMNEHFQSFESYRKNLPPIKQVWYVSKINLGDYQFDASSFSFRYDVPLNFFSPFKDAKAYNNSGLQRQAFNSRKLLHSAMHAPQGTDSKYNKAQYPRSYRVNLAMARQQARKLVAGGQNRNVYALVKLQILPFAFNDHRGSLNKGGFVYKFASPKVEVFADPDLKQKIAEATLPLKKYTIEKKPLPAALVKPKYKTVTGTKILDSRVIPLLFLQNGELKDSYFDSMWRVIPTTERQFWQEHANRIDNVERTRKIAASQSNSSIKKDTVSIIKRAEDRANLSAFSWQDKNKMNDKQLKTFYDYLLGYGEVIDKRPSWPNTLTAVPWGLNIASVFRQGHLNISKEASHLVAEGEDKQLIRKFALELANSQKITHLTLALPMKELRYQQETKTLEFAKNTGLLPVTKTELTPEVIGNNVLYYLRLSGAEVGTLTNNPSSGCSNNDKRKSRDCSIHWNNVLNLNYTPRNQLIGLDKLLNIPNSLDISSLTSEQAVALVQASTHPGWRVVIELKSPKLRTDLEIVTKRGKSTELIDFLLLAKASKVSIIDKDDNIWWSETSKKMQGAAGYNQIKALQPPKIHQFDSPVQLNPFIEDLLLVKFAPERINDRTVDAMLSARWSYENKSESPFAGRFFNAQRRTPNYAELSALRDDYKDWMVTLSQQLPSLFNIPLELMYRSDSVKFNNSCYVPEMPKGAPVHNKKMAQNAASQRVKKCESNNRNIQSKVDRCDGYAQDIKRAKSSVEQAQASSCGQIEVEKKESEQPIQPQCSLPEPINMATLAQDMQACITETCGSLSAGIDMKAYQGCVQDTSAYLKVAMSKAMGMERKARKPAKPKDTCKPALRKLKLAEKRFEQKQCVQTYDNFVLQDCTLAEKFELPTMMPIERIRVQNSAYCSDSSLFLMARDHSSSALLLPDFKPFSDTDIEVHFYPQNLEFSYLPAQPNQNGATNIKTNIVVEIMNRMPVSDDKVLGLKAKVVSKTSETVN